MYNLNEKLMQEGFNVPKTLYFSSFRYVNLLYTIPLAFFLLIGFAKLSFYLEPLLQLRLPLWLCTVIYILGLLFFTMLIIKVFFMMNIRRISLHVDDQGFIVNNNENRKKYWSQIKSYTFPKDKFESRSNSSGSTVILSLGFMKVCVINCSIWTLLNKTRRQEEQDAFAEFKRAVVYFCSNKF